MRARLVGLGQKRPGDRVVADEVVAGIDRQTAPMAAMLAPSGLRKAWIRQLIQAQATADPLGAASGCPRDGSCNLTLCPT